MKIGVMLLAADVDWGGTTPSWLDVKNFALPAEARRFDSVWMFDHFFNRTEDGAIEGEHEAWTIASAVATVTTRVMVGTLVMCTSFRTPGLLAKMAATLDEVADGRLILGLGAGWHEPEYEAFGYPFDHRVDRFEEALQIIRRLLDGETVTFDGRFNQVREAVLAPVPRRRIPLLVAGEGPRMLRLTARYADAWNTAWFGRPGEQLRRQLAAFDEALEAEGREPATVERTVGVTIREPGSAIEEGQEDAFRGSVEEMAAIFGEYAELGVDHLILEVGPKTESALDRVAEAARAARL